jgi:hypothetical protein
MLDAVEASDPPYERLMFLRALHMYKTRNVGGAAARLRGISPSADDAFIVPEDPSTGDLPHAGCEIPGGSG